MDQGATKARAVFDSEDPPPFERFDFGSGRSIVVICDHARNQIPRQLGTLGLADHHLQDHIAWDIGARLRVPLIVGGYSRLVVDLNRAKHDASAIPSISDGVLVPGNIALDRVARQERFSAIHDVYHHAVDRLLAETRTDDHCPVIIAIHSFTPQVSGVSRPWHAGVLWDKDPRVALPLLAALRAPGDIMVGDNEPYSGRHAADYTIDTHAEPNGYAHAAIEIRQDQIQSRHGERAWAERLFHALAPIFEDKRIYARQEQ